MGWHREAHGTGARLEREKQLPIADAVQLACEVADALQHPPWRGVVGRVEGNCPQRWV